MKCLSDTPSFSDNLFLVWVLVLFLYLKILKSTELFLGMDLIYFAWYAL